MLIIQIDARTRYHRATIPGHRPFTFSNTQTGFGALQRWLSEIAPGSDKNFRIEPEGAYGSILARRLRSIGYQVTAQDRAFVLSKQKPGPHIFAPVLILPAEVSMV